MTALVCKIPLSVRSFSPVALLYHHIDLHCTNMETKALRERGSLPRAKRGWQLVLPRKAGAHVQPVHVLADEELEEAHTLQLH